MYDKIHIPIFHLASMARCGETLVLHVLSSHPDVVVVHNMAKRDALYEKRLFRFLMKYERSQIDIHHRLLSPYGVKAGNVLLIKQGVWEHAYPFKGFVLARNPLSVYASLRLYDSKHGGQDLDRNWRKYRVPRFLAWLKNIDRDLIPEFKKSSPIDQFCLFYNRRMLPLAHSGLPILHYETFVRKPEECLLRICDLFKVDRLSLHRCMDQRSDGQVGHGQFEATRPIDTASIMKFKQLLTDQECSYILENTQDTTDEFGYIFGSKSVDIDFQKFGPETIIC